MNESSSRAGASSCPDMIEHAASVLLHEEGESREEAGWKVGFQRGGQSASEQGEEGGVVVMGRVGVWGGQEVELATNLPRFQSSSHVASTHNS